jgi:phosphopantothenoylcysteine synthetase/decarboxylase
VVVNDVSDPDIGFSSESNAVTIVTADGHQEVEKADKLTIADTILSAVDGLSSHETASSRDRS